MPHSVKYYSPEYQRISKQQSNQLSDKLNEDLKSQLRETHATGIHLPTIQSTSGQDSKGGQITNIESF